MISKRLTTFALSVLCAILTVGALNAQTFNGNIVNTAGNSAIPSTGTGGCTPITDFLNPVAGLTNQVVQSVQINLTHTWDADLGIYLVSPSGQRIELSSGNGGSADNYTNTQFSDAAATNITAGAAPFTGTFRPEGSVNVFFCNTTGTIATLGAFTAAQNGNWTLRFEDGAAGDAGVMLSWSITFAPPCGFVAATLPNINVTGTNPALCGAAVNTTVPLIAATCPVGTLVSIQVDGGAVTQQAPGTPFGAGVLPLGTHTIRFSLPNGMFIVQTVIVGDGVPPVVTCPSNVTINLDPGACSQIFNYTVSATDNCPSNLTGFFSIPDTNIALGAQSLSCNPGVIQNNYFQVVTVPGSNFTTNFVRVGIVSTWPAGSSAAATIQIRLWSLNSTTQPYNVALANRTLLGTGVPTPVPAGSANKKINIPIPGVLLPTNATVLVEVITSHPFVVATPAGTGLRTWLGSNSCGIDPNTPSTFQAVGFALDMVSILYATPPQVTPVQTSGLASGSTFTRGVTNNCFTATDAAGNTASCCFTVTVLEFPNAVTSLVCNDLVYFSLDENCSGVVGADDVLEGGPYGCYDDYIVELDRTAPFGNGPWTPAVAGPGDVGKTYQVRVTDPTTGNKCWGSIKFEDKLPPVLICHDITLPCNGNPDVFPNNQPYPAITGAQVQEQKPNNPIGEPGSPTPDVQVYNFDYNYLPTTPTLDVNMRMKLTGHTWIPDLDMVVIAPDGTTADVFTIVGCAATEYPIDVIFDDEGTAANPFFCTSFNAGGARIQGFVAPGNQSPTILSVLDGHNAKGIWKVRVSDNVAGDDGVVEIVGLEVTVNVPQIIPSDACSAITLTHIDTDAQGSCASGIAHTITRKWTATDASGNSSTCIQHINFQVPTFADVTLPPDYDGIDAPFFLCTNNAYPTPQWIEGQGLQGFPYVFGLPVGCTINWNYEDLVIDVCDGTYKIRRKWTIIDWCLGTNFEFNQIIKVVDDQGPEIACPANLTVSTDPFNCCSTTNLPDVIITDNCSRINNISGMIVEISPFTGDTIGMVPIGGQLTTYPGNNLWIPDTLGAFGYTPCLPIGTHTVTYVAEDDCGNTSFCTFRITVRDYVPPVASCDETTTVAIGIDDPFDCYLPSADGCIGAGVTLVPASVFNDGSYDNCNDVLFTVQRMGDPYSDCILALNTVNGHPDCDDIFPDFPSEFERAISEDDTIKFYCCEVGTTQTVILRVYQVDVDGNISVGPDGSPIFNSCMVQVEVQDKIKPVCQSPANVTVTCTNFDPSLWTYGKPSIYDNCCLDTSKVYQGQCGLTHSVSYTNFDTVCNRGTIVRTFRAFDCHGFSTSCTQRVVVNYVQDYFVKFPNDVIVTVCDGTGIYGEPTFLNKDCELLGVSKEDVIFTVVPDACYKIERTWTVINWCTYNPNAGCVDVPNPNPNPTVNNPANLPGPTISALGTLPPWNPLVIKIDPADPLATNYSVFYTGGQYKTTVNGVLTTFTVPPVSQVNCYRYKQIIKVIDTKAPIIANCPASPVTFCDVTPNDPLLWNESYYYDQVTGSHDLCEGPTDLTITATDACSLSAIDIHYLLFLDLNGDGTMETVINSNNLPPANTVFFGNALNQNFTGGTPYNFDERPVPLNQKYRFAIQTTTSGVNKTAHVAWNTTQSPNTYVVPELPYGTHKIKWFVADGCGNEAVCEYTFIVKDCKAPTVVCLNGLSVNIMPTQMIQLWATDFLQYAEDNCTPVAQLKYGIRRSGTGSGFPVDGNGNPITNVLFTCADLGTQPVELWAIDAAGNADYCETYVIVQDNNGNCGIGNKATVAGALKTESTSGLEEGTVELVSQGNGIPQTTMLYNSNADGSYTFSNAVPMASNATVTPNKDNNPLNGVSTYDLVLISRHILGLEPLGSPYKMIAADANKSGSITTFDIVELRKLILGIYQELPNNTSWRFVDKSFNFPNANNPFQTSFPENKSYANVAASQFDQDFVAVKIGDVNQNAIANAQQGTEDRTSGTLLIDVDDRQVQAGESFDVNFKTAEAAQGFQFTLNLNGLAVTEIAGGDKVDASNFGVFSDALTASVDGAREFTVKFRATKAGKISDLLSVSSRITKAEAYTMTGDRQEVALRFNNGGTSTIAGVGFELYQNQPNPFVGTTFIGFHLPEAAAATLTVYDESGRVIFTQKGDFAKGYNSIAVERALLNTSGMLYYKLETATDMATKKMIQSK